MRLLIVDDSRSSLALIGAIIGEVVPGEIELCLNPREAVQLCRERQYDLVIVDHIMPEMDGVEFTAALRARPAYSLVPIVMVTSDADKTVRIEAIKAGVNNYVVKPFTPDALSQRITETLSKKAA